MKLATTTEDFCAYYKEHTDRIKAVADAGFKYVDFSFYNESNKESMFLKPDWREYVNKIKDCADECGVKFIQSHAPGGNPLLNNSSYDLLLESIIRSIEICGILGIDNTVVHPGWDGQMTLEE